MTKKTDAAGKKPLTLEDLAAWAKNPRVISDEALAGLGGSIKAWGNLAGIVYNEQLGALVCGHQRIKVLRAKGATIRYDGETPSVVDPETGETFPIRVVSWNQQQHAAACIAGNNTMISGTFSSDVLPMLHELADSDPGLFESAGFGGLLETLGMQFADKRKPGSGDPDNAPGAPDPNDTVTKLGDIWIVGNHRIGCMDCIKDEDALKRLFAGGLADACVTDPPYNVDLGASMKDKLRGAKHKKIENDNLGADFYAFLLGTCKTIIGYTKGACYLCMSCQEIHTLHRAWLDAGGHWSTWVIWAKDTFTMGRADYQRQYEPILYGWGEGTKHFWCGARDQGDIWQIKRPRRNPVHPTQKPVELIERAIVNSSKSRDTVFDPFHGSGTTAVACERTGRAARTCELDPAYVDVQCARMIKLFGLNAIRESDGLVFPSDAPVWKKFEDYAG